MSERKATLTAFGAGLLAMLLVSCGTPGAPDGSRSTWHEQTARRHYARGALDAALVATGQAILQERERAASGAIELHLKLLRELGREPEAVAFSEFLKRYAAGELTDDPEAEPTRPRCEKFWRDLKPSKQLILEWGPTPKGRPFRITPSAASFEVAALGQPINMRVGRASHPGAAWVMISWVARAKWLPLSGYAESSFLQTGLWEAEGPPSWRTTAIRKVIVVSS